jgi:ATP synthase protein I
MGDPDRNEPSPLDRLGQRIAAARQQRAQRSHARSGPASTSGLGFGLRIATEMVAALAVGVGMGLLLDHWLGTGPWMLILFFVLGAAAAFTNLIRLAKEAEAARARETDTRDSDPR